MAATNMKNRDLLAVRAYVTAKDGTQYDAATAGGTVVLDLTHSNLRQRHAEVRFGTHDPLGELRSRIHRKTGTPPPHQHLQVYDRDGVLLREIPPAAEADHYKLGYFGILHHGMRVHCVDVDPHSISTGGALEDVSLVEKFQLTEEQYDAKKGGTLRAWARQQRELNPAFTYGSHAKQHAARMEALRRHRAGSSLPAGFQVDGATGEVVASERRGPEDEYGPDSVRDVSIGCRCQVRPGGRRGVTAWKGGLPGLPGRWVGVRLDEPTGRNDGTYGGARLFDCEEKHGVFVRGPNVETGDFPEEWEEDDSSSEDEL